MKCIQDALTRDNIKGFEYAVRGPESVTFDGVLDTLSQYCQVPKWEKVKRSYAAGFLERFVIGHTHDKNVVQCSVTGS